MRFEGGAGRRRRGNTAMAHIIRGRPIDGLPRLST